MTLQIQCYFKKNHFTFQFNSSIPLYGITVLTGHSGCGKTTLLRCIAGFEKFTGNIYYENEIWQNSKEKLFLKPHKRNIGFVFQHGNLFPHLNVQKNLEYSHKRSPKKISFHDVVDLFCLKSLLCRFPHVLSGGERQLVAIARTLLSSPNLLLMDEPVSSLDSKSKDHVLHCIEDLQRYFKIPILYVTHSDEEAKRLGQHFINMENRMLKNDNK